MPNASPALNMLLATLFFSLMDVLVKWLPRIPTSQIVFFRAAIALLICLWLIRRARLHYFGTHRLLLSLRGVFGTLALILYFYSLKNMPLASAVTIQKLSPVFTVTFACLLRKEKFHPATWGYFLLAMIGAGLIKGFDHSFSLAVFVLAILAAVSSAMAYNCISELKESEHPLVIIMYFPLITLPTIAPITFKQWVAPNLFEWALLILLGVVVQTAQYFMTLAYQKGSTEKIASIVYLGTVIAVCMGYFFFGETPRAGTVFGIILTVVAVLQLQRLPKPKPAPV